MCVVVDATQQIGDGQADGDDCGSVDGERAADAEGVGQETAGESPERHSDADEKSAESNTIVIREAGRIDAERHDHGDTEQQTSKRRAEQPVGQQLRRRQTRG